jgi:hypothetical protein
VRRLLALFVTVTTAVGLAGGLTAGAAAAAVIAPVAAPPVTFGTPVVRTSAAREVVRKGPQTPATRSRSRAAAVDVSGPATALINVTYSGFPAQAHAAFAAAVDIWAHTIHSSVPIEVSADWSDLTALYGDNTILGAAGPTTFVANVPNATFSSLFYPVALANAISGRDLLTANLCTRGQISPTGAEIAASFNSTEPDWYYGTDGSVPSGKVDLESCRTRDAGISA